MDHAARCIASRFRALSAVFGRCSPQWGVPGTEIASQGESAGLSDEELCQPLQATDRTASHVGAERPDGGVSEPGS